MSCYLVHSRHDANLVCDLTFSLSLTFMAQLWCMGYLQKLNKSIIDCKVGLAWTAMMTIDN